MKLLNGEKPPAPTTAADGTPFIPQTPSSSTAEEHEGCVRRRERQDLGRLHQSGRGGVPEGRPQLARNQYGLESLGGGHAHSVRMATNLALAAVAKEETWKPRSSSCRTSARASARSRSSRA